MALLGERLTGVTQRLRTPTSGEWADGDFIDAGLAMVLSSNLAQLQRESVRHLASALGPGQITNATRGYTYSGTPLTDAADPGTYSQWSVIAWDLQTSTVFAPIHLIRDREITGDVPGFRKVRVNIDAQAAAASLTLLACLTAVESTPRDGPLAFGSVTATTGHAINTITLTLEPEITSRLVDCRPPTGTTPEQSSVYRLALWVGWYASAGTNYVLSINADEIR